MIKTFSITLDPLDPWIVAEQGADEFRETTALLSIAFDGHLATRAFDAWSQTVKSSVLLSAYPLAQWLAASWWRLRWEPRLGEESAPVSLSWRMAHETASVGHGYLWPRLAFDTDGEIVEAFCRASGDVGHEPIRYLENFRASMPAKVFERGIDDFMRLVLERLAAVGMRDTDLRVLWQEVLEERADPEASRYRKLEAYLGFDPDEAPEAVLADLTRLSGEVGAAAMTEIAPICSGEDPAATLQKIVDLAQVKGAQGRIDVPPQSGIALRDFGLGAGAPWERGYRLAREARAAWNLKPGPLSDKDMASILAVPEKALGYDSHPQSALRLGLAVRDKETQVNLLFRRKDPQGRRFEAARFVAEHLVAPEGERWLPATDYKTARQKLQRAFAVEFLCPINSLQEYLGDNYSSDALGEASWHYKVSEQAIMNHLENNGLLSRDALSGV